MENVNVNSTPSEATVNTSVDNGQVSDTGAIDNQSQGQGTQTNDDFFDGGKVAKAFSTRLNKEREKLMSQYQPYERVLDIAAKEFGMNRDQYIQSILEQYAEDGQTPNITKEEPSNEKEALLNELLQEKKSKEIAEQWNGQVQELLKINSDLKPEDISDEMLLESQEKGIPLQYLYAHSLLTANRENFEKSIQEKTIANLQKINRTTGSLTSTQTNLGAVKISDMSKSDFEALKEKVKRGEIRSFD